MLKQILFSHNLSLKERIKNSALYINRKRGAKISWKNRHNNVLKANKTYNRPCATEIEDEHQKIWSDFRKKVDLTTLRICSNISDNSDIRVVPEDIFVSDIEPSLTIDSSVDFLSNKSFYNRWYPDGIFPKDLFHRISGQYLSMNFEERTHREFIEFANYVTYPLVIKPNKDSFGGKGIHFVNNSEHLIKVAESEENFVIQEKIEQHDFFKKFNPAGLNTIRVYVYKSVKDDKLHIIASALRMGKDGSLDNETDGGIHTMITPQGYLNGYAVDKFGNKYYEHPNTKFKFVGPIPDFEGLKSISSRVAAQVFYTRIIGLDVCYDNSDKWRVIEINTKGHSIRFSQYGGKPFFGEFTNEVIEFCRENHWALT